MNSNESGNESSSCCKSSFVIYAAGILGALLIMAFLVAKNPASAYTAKMHLLNARTLMQMAENLQEIGRASCRERV